MRVPGPALLHGLLLSMLLTACGGGGGAGGGSTGSTGGTTNPPATTPARDVPLVFAASNTNDVQDFSMLAVQQTMDFARYAAGALLGLAVTDTLTSTQQCVVPGSDTRTVTLDDVDGSGRLSAGDRARVAASNCTIPVPNLELLRGDLQLDVREYFRGRSGDVFMRVRVTTVGELQGVVRRANPAASIPRDVTGTMRAAFDVLVFATERTARLQVLAAPGDTVLLREFDGGAHDREERLTNFAFEHMLRTDGRYAVTYRFDANADGVRRSLLRGRFHCETTAPLVAPTFGAPQEGAALCTGAGAGRITATTSTTGPAGVIDLRVDPEGDGSGVEVLTAQGVRSSWGLGELVRYTPLRLPVLGDGGTLLTFSRPVVALAGAVDAVPDPASGVLYLLDGTRLSALDAAGTLLRSRDLPFRLPGTLALSEDGGTLYVGGDSSSVLQLRAGDLATQATVALGDAGSVPRTPRDLAVAPGRSNLLLVTTDFTQELLAYRDGALLARALTAAGTPEFIAFRDANTLVGLAARSSPGDVLSLVDVLADGPALRASLANFVLALPSGLVDGGAPVLTREGRLIDVENGVLVGTLGAEGITASHVGGVRDPAGDLAYMLTQDSTLVVYDVARQSRLRTFDLAGIGVPVGAVSLGSGRFAAYGTAGIQYFTRAEVGDATVQRPCASLDLSGKVFDGTYIVVDCPLRAAVADAARNRIVASVRPQEGILGNAIAVLDAASGAISRQVHVGSGPGALRLAADGTSAHVTLGGASLLPRVDIDGMAAPVTLSLGASPSGLAPAFATAVLEIGGNPDDLLVSVEARVVRYTGGVRSGIPTLEALGTQLFAGPESDSAFVVSDGGDVAQLRVDGAGVAVARRVTAGFRGRAAAAGGRLYDSAGRVLDMGTLALGSTCAVVADVVLPDLANNRIYYARSDAALATLSVCTPGSGAIRTREIPNFGAALGMLLDALDVGGGRLALVGSNGIVLLDKADL